MITDQGRWDDRDYYDEHFYDIMYDKITEGMKLTVDEMDNLVSAGLFDKEIVPHEEYLEVNDNNQKMRTIIKLHDKSDRPEEISEKDWEKRYHLWEKAIGPEYFLPDHGFMVNLYDTSMELFRTNFPFYKESVPDYDDILYRLMNTLYPDIEGDQWEDKWNELKRNCPKMDMDGIGQIFDLTERRS